MRWPAAPRRWLARAWLMLALSENTGHDSSMFAPERDARRSRPPLTAVS